MIRNDQQRRCKHHYVKPARPTDLFAKCAGCGHRAALARINRPAYLAALEAHVSYRRPKS